MQRDPARRGRISWIPQAHHKFIEQVKVSARNILSIISCVKKLSNASHALHKCPSRSRKHTSEGSSAMIPSSQTSQPVNANSGYHAKPEPRLAPSNRHASLCHALPGQAKPNPIASVSPSCPRKWPKVQSKSIC
ncbi:hypothetical protein DL98DRAFT_13688 [Cadophora sp. DSE1049]|nr:hypothetical protein DL98DRAFT_13688 [Cadophora sp. DSE1049]